MNDRFEQLLECLLADEIDERELRELDHLTTSDPNLAHRLISELEADAALHAVNRQPDVFTAVNEYRRSQRVRAGVMAQVERSHSSRWRNEGGRRQKPRVHGLRHSRGRTRAHRRQKQNNVVIPLMVGVALAATFMLAIMWNTQPAPSPVDGLQVTISQPVIVNGQHYAVGAQTLPWGAVVEGDGLMLQLADATSLEVDGQVRIPFKDRQRQWMLEQGRVTCAVTPRKPGNAPFRVSTKDGVVEVLGTRFEVRVLANETNVAVDHGRVQLSDSSGVQKLSGGDSGVMRKDPLPSQTDIPDASPHTTKPNLTLTLVDPDDNNYRQQLRDGSIINLQNMQQGQMNIHVDAGEDVGALRFRVNGQHIDGRVAKRPGGLEYRRPFYIYGDDLNDGSVHSYRPNPGVYQLEIEIFSDESGEKLLDTQRFNFTVRD